VEREDVLLIFNTQGTPTNAAIQRYLNARRVPQHLELPMLLSGIRINTSPTDYYPIEHVRLLRFDGERSCSAT
jgi:hypothetical protein